MELEKLMRKINQEEFQELCYKAEGVRKDAIHSATNPSVKQCVATSHGSHWLFTYFRTVDDLCDDTWTCVISRIELMHVDTVTTDTPICSNVIPRTVIDSEGNKIEVHVEVEDSEDD